ncbi:MAG: DUF2062 domain-containing protein [Pseudomonadota bacterium]
MAEHKKDWGARTIKRVAAWFERQMPTRDGMRKNRYLKPIAHRFLRSDLWRFTRRSVPRGVALGMLAAFLIPVGQIFAAVFLALPVRANVPIAALTTFITNPFTYPFWIAVANQIGKFVLRIDALTAGQPLNEGMRSGLGEWLSWFVREAGVTAFGFLLLAVVFGAFGYVLSSLGWRWWVARKRAKRLNQLGLKQVDYGE